MTGLRITVCLGTDFVDNSAEPRRRSTAPSSAPGTTASSPSVSPQAPSAPDTPVYATTPTQEGSHRRTRMSCARYAPALRSSAVHSWRFGAETDGDFAARIAVVGGIRTRRLHRMLRLTSRVLPAAADLSHCRGSFRTRRPS